MFDKIIAYSIQHKFVIFLMILALIAWGSYSIKQIPIDAVPDITNNQIQIITNSPSLATLEVEQFITTPIELSLQNLQNLVEIRSISRFGLSVVTVVFEEDVETYFARQLVQECLASAQQDIPENLGTPEMAPVSTGLGEIYQYVLAVDSSHKDKYNLSDLRSMQDWIVRRQLSGIEGVAEVNSIGGYLKQYEIGIDPELLRSMDLTLDDVFTALAQSNANVGGSYIEKNSNAYYIRSEGLIRSLEDIGNIVIKTAANTPVLIRDVADIQFGKAPRFGALVKDGVEAVGGKVMMFKGANAAGVTKLIDARVAQVNSSLPEGVHISPYLVRDKLVNTAIGTVKKNLLEGGLIVVFVLVLFLGNYRASMIVASVIPLAMLFAISMMNLLGISANLMSLGAIDFGLIVDGAIIIVEAILHKINGRFAGQRLSQEEMDKEVTSAAQGIRQSAAFGELIILMVYIPILSLVGIEGKMFKPMAQTVMLAILGALILSLTYVPMMSAMLLNKNIKDKPNFSDRMMAFFQGIYSSVLEVAFKMKSLLVGLTILIFVFSLWVFSNMGGEFIPTLEEGDLAMQQILPPGSSLSQSVATAQLIQHKLLEDFHEIEEVVVNIGSAEIPTDPMPVEIGDYTLIMKPKSEWTHAHTRKGMFASLDESLSSIPGIDFEYSQPIQLRFNELMTGSKADIAIKLYGADLDELYRLAMQAKGFISEIPGVGTVNVEQTLGMPQIVVQYNYARLAQYGLHVGDINRLIQTAFAGAKAGTIYEADRRFDMVLRLKEEHRADIASVRQLNIPIAGGVQVPLSSVASIELKDAPMQISREQTNRNIVIGVNVGNTDVERLVEKIKAVLGEKIKLPTAYFFTFGGQFENLKEASARLMIAVPIALGLILILLYFTFHSFAQSLLIFTAIPLASIGGIWALYLRDMPFSISAGIGFIALFGVAVLNGIVLIGQFNQLKNDGMTDVMARIMEGTKTRLRPVLLTANVASLGFLPMALSNSGGAEVQRPLATVVIGGLITATFLTLVILPILYYWMEKLNWKKLNLMKQVNAMLVILFACPILLQAQTKISLPQAMEEILDVHPAMQAVEYKLQRQQQLSEMKYNLGNTDFFYQGDALFTGNSQMLNQLGFNQNFSSGKGYKAENLLNQQMYNSTLVERDLKRNLIKFNIKQVYYELQYKKSVLEIYEEMLELYDNYHAIAERRNAAGASTPIDELQIKSKREELLMLEAQSHIEIDALEKKFSVLFGDGVSYTSQGELTIPGIMQVDSFNSTFIEKAKAEIGIQQALVEVEKAERSWDYNIGYAIQNYFDGGWYSGLQAGISMPLFSRNINRRVEAQEIAIAESKSNLEARYIILQEQLIEAKKSMDIYEKGMMYYKKRMDTYDEEMVRLASLNYTSGEMSYLELLDILDNAEENKMAYLTQLYQYVLSIANYEFITNQ